MNEQTREAITNISNICTNAKIKKIIMGKSIQEAQALLPDYTFRELEIDGVDQPYTLECSSERINVATEDGKIVQFIDIG